MRLAPVLLVAVATGGCPRAAAPPTTATTTPATAPGSAAAATAGDPAYAEAMAECSPADPPLRKLVFETRIDRCGPERAAPLLRELDDIGASDGWLMFTGKDADVAALRALGCSTAVLCTEANHWAILLETVPSEKLLPRLLAVRAAARPPP